MMYITTHEHIDHDLLQLTDEDLLELPEEAWLGNSFIVARHYGIR